LQLAYSSQSWDHTQTSPVLGKQQEFVRPPWGESKDPPRPSPPPPPPPPPPSPPPISPRTSQYLASLDLARRDGLSPKCAQCSAALAPAQVCSCDSDQFVLITATYSTLQSDLSEGMSSDEEYNDNVVNAERHYDEACDALGCATCSIRTFWNYFGTISGNFGTVYTVEFGTEGSKQMEQAVSDGVERAWSTETSTEETTGRSTTDTVGVSISMEVGTGKLLPGASVTSTADYSHSMEQSTEVTEAQSRSIASSMMRTLAQTTSNTETTRRTQTMSRDFHLPGVVWRAEMIANSKCGNLRIFLDEFAVTATAAQPPRCLPGWCQMYGYCCQCTEPWAALQESTGDCLGPHCPAAATVDYSFGYRLQPISVGCGQRVEPGGVCHADCSQAVRGVIGSIKLQCSSVTGTLSVVEDTCKRSSKDRGYFIRNPPHDEADLA